MHVGIIGCGAIGSEVAAAAPSIPGVRSLLLWDTDADALDALADATQGTPAESAAALVNASDVVIECAAKAVVETAVLDALAAGKRAIILTVGALADDDLRDRLVAAAAGSGGKLHVPSGAVMGLDGIRAAAEGDLKAVTLVTTKPNAGLDREVDRWTLLFNGPARKAVSEFPKNVNVAASLSLAGVGLDKTWVQVAADPLASHNHHKVIVEGDFGRARIEVENLPSPRNARTSRLAALSTLAVLRRILSPIEIGA